MFKLKTVLLSLGISLLVFTSFLFAADETLTITTYYPSPYGSYNEFKVASNTWLAYSSGNVGIGTTGPDNKLSVNVGGAGGSGVNTALRISGGGMSTVNDATRLLLLQRDSYDDYGAAIQLTTTQSTPSYLNPRLDFLVQNTDTNLLTNMGTKMTILGSGNVGIGTTNPGSKFQVVGTSNEIASIVGTSNPYITVGTASNAGGYVRWNTDSNTIQLGHHGVSGGGGVYVRTTDGNVGIGTTGPSQQLQIKAISNYPQLYLTQYNDDRGWKFAGLSDGHLHIYSSYHGADTERMTITYDTGNVGIGTASPSYPLQVNGAISLGGSNLNALTPRFIMYDDGWNTNYYTYGVDALTRWKTTGGIYVMGVTVGGTRLSDAGTAWGYINSTSGWQAGSSRTLKQNIIPLSDNDYQDIRQQFNKMTLYSYNRKDTPQIPEVGFIAEESPALISEDHFGISPLRAIGFLAAVVKDQESRLQKQQQDIEHLKQELIGSTAMLIESNQNLQANTREIQELKAEIVSLQKKL